MSQSESARAVAQEVVALIRKGKRVNKGEIIRRHGYSESAALKPSKVTSTKSYREEIAPIVEAMERERDAIMKVISKKRAKAKYRDLIDGVDKLTKNIQLLNGGKTSNEKVTVGWEE